jgi:hypothetical protein
MNIQSLQAEILRCGAVLTQQGLIRIAEQLGWGVDHWQANDAILTRPGHAAVCIPWNMTAADLRQRLKVLFQARLQEGRSLADQVPSSSAAQHFIAQVSTLPHGIDASALSRDEDICQASPVVSKLDPNPDPNSDLNSDPNPDPNPDLNPNPHPNPHPNPNRDPHLDADLLDAFVTALTLVVEQSQITFVEVAGEQFRHLQQQFERYELEQIQILDDTLDELVRQYQLGQTRRGRSPGSLASNQAVNILPQVGYPTPTPAVDRVDRVEPQQPEADAIAAVAAQAAALAQQVTDLQKQLRDCQGKLAQTQRTLGRTQSRLRTARSTIAQISYQQVLGWGDRPWANGHPRSALAWVTPTPLWMRPMVWAVGMVIVLGATAWVAMSLGNQQTQQSLRQFSPSLPVLLGRLPLSE